MRTMNISRILTKLSILFGFAGCVAFIFAWIAELKAFVLGFESLHWYQDATVLLLIAIWFKLGAIYHKSEGSGSSAGMASPHT